MKTLTVIFCLFYFSFCSYANRDSVLKITPVKIIPSSNRNNFEFNNAQAINFKLPYPNWPRDMDLAEGIILSIGGTFSIPFCLDLYNERRPISELAIGGLAVYASCVLTAIVYRVGFKGKHNKQKKWDR